MMYYNIVYYSILYTNIDFYQQAGILDRGPIGPDAWDPAVINAFHYRYYHCYYNYYYYYYYHYY